MNVKTATVFYMRLRQLLEEPSFELLGVVEADEGYFESRRKGKCGCGTVGRIAVFSAFSSLAARFMLPSYRMKNSTPTPAKIPLIIPYLPV